jgi:DNA-binding HxlR family transcriptional regulator
MPRKRVGLFDFLDEPNVVILKCLKEKPHGYTELMKKSTVSSGTFSDRLNELLELGLVKARYSEKERRPLYILTPTGRRILELLEEIEKVYKEGVSLEEKEEKWVEEQLWKE